MDILNASQEDLRQAVELVQKRRDYYIHLAASVCRAENVDKVSQEMYNTVLAKFGAEDSPNYSTAEIVIGVCAVLDTFLAHAALKDSPAVAATQNNT